LIIQPDNSPTLGSGAWIDIIEYTVYSDTGIIGTTSHGPRLSGDSRSNLAPIKAYHYFSSQEI
jgi:hypothetical protein